MSRRADSRDINRLHRRHVTVLRRPLKRGERQAFRRETRFHLGVQT